MTAVSLQEIMNDMARRLDDIQPEKTVVRLSNRLSVFDFYRDADPVLADLDKQYIDMKARHKKLLCENGAHDPMAEIAGDLVMSSESAMQTRLIELRQDKRVRRVILQRIRAARKEIQQAERRQKRDYEALILRNVKSARKAKKDGEDGFLIVMFLLWMLRRTLQVTQHNLSLANTFALVSEPAIIRS